MRRCLRLLALCLILAPVCAGTHASAQATSAPYFVTLASAKAHMRTGPSTDYPIRWTYRRLGLPLLVTARHADWRRVRDHERGEGWMHVSKLGNEPHALILAREAPLRAAPRADAAIAWRAARGVTGRISRCAAGWCLFDAAGRRGFVRMADIWGR